MHFPKSAIAALLLVASAVASDTPQQAILDTVFAKDSKTVLRHLPRSVAETIEALPEKQREKALERLLPKNWFGAKPVRVDDGVNLLRAENPAPRGENEQPVFIRVTRQISNGAEAVLQLEACQESCFGALQIWMVLQDGEWRFTEVREGGRSMAKFDEPEFLANLREQARGGGERQAVANLRTLNTALVTYLSTYSKFPEKIKQLSGIYPQDPSEEQAMLLDEQFMAEPCIIGGYVFQYRRLGEEQYEVIVRPVEYGEGSSRSFYTDESGIIRATTDNRPATKEDKPI